MTPFVKKIALPALGLTMAASLALSPLTATPARAEPDGGALAFGAFALLLAGIAAGSAVHSEPSYQPPRQPPQPPRGYNPEPPRWTPHPQPQPQPMPPSNPRWGDSKELPRECRVTYRLGSTSAPYYDKSCLMQEYRGWAYLPDRCEQTVRILGSGSGRQTVYAESCLSRFGYTPEERWGRR